jgi:hypothetical protein
MKHLKDIVVESFFDDDLESPNITMKLVKDSIKSFLKSNYRGASQCKISRKLNEDGKYVVDRKGALIVTNNKIESLTNDLFVFGTVDRCFECASCYSLTSLEGAPKVVKESFICSWCVNLASLKGAPEKVGNDFNCAYCGIESLEYSPKEVGGNFLCNNCIKLTSLKGITQDVKWGIHCNSCKSLVSLEGAPKVVKGDFNCTGCDALTSLKYAPNEVWGYFSCDRCDSLKTLEHSPKIVHGDYFAPWNLKGDAMKYCKVGRYIR